MVRKLNKRIKTEAKSSGTEEKVLRQKPIKI